MSGPQISSTTFGFINSGDHNSITIGLGPIQGTEYPIMINGNKVDDIDIPQEGGSTTETISWKDGLLSVTGTMNLSLSNGRYWACLTNPNITRGNWAQITEATGGKIGGAFIIATWKGTLPTTK